MRTDVIVKHENWQRESWRAFLLRHWRKNQGNRALPPEDGYVGVIDAYINHGRWVADCPTPGCGAAYIVTPNDTSLLCGNCGTGWWFIRFPRDRSELEQLLLKRIPGVGRAPTRNWLPNQTVDDIRDENTEMGIE